MNILLFVNQTKKKIHAFTSFKWGCLSLGLPYHSLKQKEGYPKNYEDWKILKQKLYDRNDKIVNNLDSQNFDDQNNEQLICHVCKGTDFYITNDGHKACPKHRCYLTKRK